MLWLGSPGYYTCLETGKTARERLARVLIARDIKQPRPDSFVVYLCSILMNRRLVSELPCENSTPSKEQSSAVCKAGNTAEAGVFAVLRCRLS
jgi:hypothetical protein